MTYILKNNFGGRKSESRGRKAIILIFSAILVSLGFYFFDTSLARLTVPLFAPLMQARNAVWKKVGSGFVFLKPKSDLIAQNEFLKNTVSDLEGELLAARAAQRNESLFMKEDFPAGKFIAAVPLSFPPYAPYDTIIMNKGTDDGVSERAKVFVANNVEIGTVDWTASNQSRVKLFSASEIKTEAFLLRTGENIELLGIGSNNFKVELPLDFDIEIGDLLALPGEARTIVAKVVSIKKDESSSFISVLLTLPIKLNSNSTLYVQH